jgi:hypothetical protein
MRITIFCAASVLLTGAAAAGNPKYAGDVVGRSLSFTELEGHVALWTGSSVFEMNTGGMRYLTLSDFKAGGKNNVFYGAKGVGSISRSSVPAVAIGQRTFSPVYTTLAEYWPGGVAKGKKYDFSKRRWVDVTRQFPGKFRCDTMVNYAYRYGGVGYIRAMTEEANNEFSGPTEYYVRTRGYTNNNARQSITPKLLYGSLPTSR